MADKYDDELEALLRDALADADARKPEKERQKERMVQRLRLEPIRNYIRDGEAGGTIIGPRGCFFCGGQHLTLDCEVG